MKAALYARKSLDEQDGARSTIESQLEEMHKYCHEHDIEIVKEYVDNGVRGWMVSRDALDQMMKDIRKSRKEELPYDIILVAEWDRFFRDFANAKLLLDEIEARGFTTGSVRGGIVRNKTERVGRDIMLYLSELDNDLRRGHVIAGQIHWARLGYSPGGVPPYGYRRKIVADEYGRPRIRYTICEEEAQVIRYIYQEYAEGASIDNIAQQLTELHILTPTQKSVWNSHTVWRILFGYTSQYKYRGYVVFNIKQINKKYKIRHYKPKAEWVFAPGAHEPILSEELVCAVNARHMAKDRTHYSKYTPIELRPGHKIDE